MDSGTCPLCLRPDQVLENSHLIPAAAYKLLREPAKQNPNPVSISKESALITSRQVRQPLLCEDCEDRLNEGGERYVLDKAARPDGSFKLRELVLQGSHLGTASDFAAYEIGSVLGKEAEQIIHFASGVFWKASATTWRSKGEKLPRMKYGPYEDDLRAYVAGESPFPDRACLILQVSNAPTPDPIVAFPHATKHNGMFRYKFQIPGLQFVLFIGGKLPAGATEHSLDSDVMKTAYLCDLRSDASFKGMLSLAGKAGSVKRPRRGS